MSSLCCLIPAVLLLCTTAGRDAAAAVTLRAESFGAVGDGTTDDGPAIARMLSAAAAAEAPVTVEFQPARTYYAKTSSTRYLLNLSKVRDLTIDGARSTFILDPYIRFLSLTDSRNITLRGLNVDFRPLPFVDGTVAAVDAEARCLDVELPDGAIPPVGGPTGEDGEQAFFSMLWYEGPYGSVSRHYWTQRIESGPTPGTGRVYAGPEFTAFGDIQPGVWRISLPVPGIAHRFGPGPCFRIEGNDTVMLEDIELWSAPWFGFEVSRNRGRIAFRRVNIRPRPDGGRLMSLWRDGFHVKGNSASLLWEDCVVEGMNDDAFNVSTHTGAVQRVLSETRIEVGQKFPLLPIPWQAGATLLAADEASRRLLGSAQVLEAQAGPTPPPIQGMPAAPSYTLTLDRRIEGLTPGTMVWDPAQCNPDTTLRRCRIGMSCRMQSPVRLEGCEVTALLWFYSEHVEGAFPSNVTVRDCILRRGRGNPTLAVVFSGAPSPEAGGLDAGLPPRAIHDVLLERNEVWGGLRIEGVERLTLRGNRYCEPGAEVTLRGNHGEVVEDRPRGR